MFILLYAIFAVRPKHCLDKKSLFIKIRISYKNYLKKKSRISHSNIAIFFRVSKLKVPLSSWFAIARCNSVHLSHHERKIILNRTLCSSIFAFWTAKWQQSRFHTMPKKKPIQHTRRTLFIIYSYTILFYFFSLLFFASSSSPAILPLFHSCCAVVVVVNVVLPVTLAICEPGPCCSHILIRYNLLAEFRSLAFAFFVHQK